MLFTPLCPLLTVAAVRQQCRLPLSGRTVNSCMKSRSLRVSLVRLATPCLAPNPLSSCRPCRPGDTLLIKKQQLSLDAWKNQAQKCAILLGLGAEMQAKPLQLCSAEALPERCECDLAAAL